MLLHTTTLAIRHLISSRVNSIISLFGLVIGLTVFLFGQLIVAYERDHDRMFANFDRIYTVGSVFNPDADEPILEYPNARTIYGPLFRKAMPEAVQVARSIHREHIISTDDTSQWLGIRFNDPGFTQIFDFVYLAGDASALERRDGLILTRSTAEALFGTAEVQNRTLKIDHTLNLTVTAVIEDVPRDSHFNSSWLPNSELTMMASINALVDLGGIDLAGEWESLNPADFTYVLLPDSLDQQWLQEQVDEVMAEHVPDGEMDYINALKVRPLDEANTQIWDALGFPVLQSVALLGLMVLIAAGINHANLSTAQAFGRTREVGLRKTFGASRAQLHLQFLLEALVLVALAAWVALAVIELLVPLYNQWTGKGVRLLYAQLLPTLLLACLITALISSAYPAWLIAREQPIDSLRGRFLKGTGGHRFRSLMIVVQFSISIFILAMVLIIHFQNRLFDDLSSVYPREQIRVLERVDHPLMVDHQVALQQALLNVDGVQSVSLSGGVPFLQTGGYRMISGVPETSESAFEMRLVNIDAAFLQTYDIELIEGRLPTMGQPHGAAGELLINRLTAETLGLSSDDGIVGQTVFSHSGGPSDTVEPWVIVGLVDDEYFLGVHMKQRAIGFAMLPETYGYASIRLDGTDFETIEAQIEAAWLKQSPTLPIRLQPLDHYFNRFFRIATTIQVMVVLFAGVAMALALIGLFGLAAFMAQRRTREIGLRKVMGASALQITRLLVWQFSRPVLIAMLIAIPLAWWASELYLGFYPERIDTVISVIALACLIALGSAWSVIAIQAHRIARSSPVDALRSR